MTHLRAEYLDKGASPSGTVIKNPPANAGDARDTSLISGSGRGPENQVWKTQNLILKLQYWALPAKPYALHWEW